MTDLTWIDLFIMIFASFRLTRLVVFDDIFSFMRKPFLTVTYENNEDGELLQVVEIKGRGLRSWIGQLLSCHWCTGIWTTSMIIAINHFFPSLYVLSVILAIAGVAGVIQSIVDRIV